MCINACVHLCIYIYISVCKHAVTETINMTTVVSQLRSQGLLWNSSGTWVFVNLPRPNQLGSMVVEYLQVQGNYNQAITVDISHLSAPSGYMRGHMYSYGLVETTLDLQVGLLARELNTPSLRNIL